MEKVAWILRHLQPGQVFAMSTALRILVFGAHPDDCDLKAGGTAALWVRAGHQVKFVSVTNGDAGHQTMGGAPLARRRAQEAQAAAAAIGIEYEVFDNHDGELVPGLDQRRQVIAAIRRFAPDLVLTPRPWDYHPDHRYTAQLVQDAAYTVTVPNILGNTPALASNPVICYVSDGFEKPYPFRPDVVVDITPVIEPKVRMLHCHASQFYEWLPWHAGELDSVPTGETDRLSWLADRMRVRFGREAERFRAQLIARYGSERGSQAQYAEAFEACEYGARLTPEKAAALFPF